MPVHLPGLRNIQADALSHVGQTILTEWSVSSFSVFLMGNTSHRYIDAMPISWSGIGMVYVLPPFKCYRLYSTRFIVPMICQ